MEWKIYCKYLLYISFSSGPLSKVPCGQAAITITTLFADCKNCLAPGLERQQPL